MPEFAIWGIPPGQTESTLLYAMPGGLPVTDGQEANRVLKILEKNHGCTRCYIQTIDGTTPDFAATLNK